MKGKFEKIINSKTPVIIYWYETSGFNFGSDDDDDDFSDQLEVFDKLKDSLKEKIKIIKIDTFGERNKQLADRYKIRKLPFIQIFKEGKELFNSKSFKEFSSLMDMILDTYSGEKEVEDGTN